MLKMCGIDTGQAIKDDGKAVKTPVTPIGAEADVKFTYPFEILKPMPEKRRLLLFGGIEGAGKSTMACITAWYMAAVGYRTLLLTADPATHIGIILGCDVDHEVKPVAAVPRLWTTRIDRKEATRAYKEKILDEARGQFEADTLTAMEEDLDSPCTEEMATLDRLADFTDNPEFDVVVFDTVPSGHTLRLLEFPSDCDKQVEMMIGSGEGTAVRQRTRRRFESIIRRLKDQDTTLFTLVLSPEETSIVEAHRTFLDLQAAGIRVGLVVVNQLLKNAPLADASYQSRRQRQRRCLVEVARRFPCPLAAMPLLSEKVAGLVPLKEAAEYFFAWSAEDMRDA